MDGAGVWVDGVVGWMAGEVGWVDVGGGWVGGVDALGGRCCSCHPHQFRHGHILE